MIVSHKHKFIFLRIPKAASTSVEFALAGICGPKDILTLLKLKNEPDPELGTPRMPQNFERRFWSFKLSDWYNIIIRGKGAIDYKHAYASQVKTLVGSRVWSEYYKFCIVRNPFDRAISMYHWKTKNWAAKQAQPLPDINDYIISVPPEKMSTWNRYTIYDNIVMDFIGRFENLEHDLAVVTEKIGIAPLVLPKAKSHYRKDRRHYSEVINPTTRAYIEKICAAEIEAFGYHWQSLA